MPIEIKKQLLEDYYKKYSKEFNLNDFTTKSMLDSSHNIEKEEQEKKIQI